MSTTIHPSRTAPPCIACKFAFNGQHGRLMCNHPSVPVSPANRQPVVQAEHCRMDLDSKVLGYANCGPAGTLFEQRAVDLIQLCAELDGQVRTYVAEPAKGSTRQS